MGSVSKGLASRFFQLSSGHAALAPSLKESFGWVEPDICWWCGSGRQAREHCVKGCITWKSEIKKLWRSFGEASGRGKGLDNVYKGRKGFGYGARGRNGPGKTTVRELSADERFIEAGLEF